MADTKETLLLAVGECLETWSQVEHTMSQTFETVSDIPKRTKALSAYEAIISFETRADVLDVLMSQEEVSDLEKETWARCSARVRKLYKKRHEIAHFTIINHVNVDTNTHIPRLSPFMTIGGLIRNDLRYLSGDDIRKRTEKFRELNAGLMWFYLEALARRGRPPLGNPMPDPPLVVHCRELAVQILEERARKQQGTPHICIPRGPV